MARKSGNRKIRIQCFLQNQKIWGHAKFQIPTLKNEGEDPILSVFQGRRL